ncbi:MAG: thioesterase family protein [Bacteroidales bacterium]|nr:thioesterase family protein [Bacteroidales bacterium]
MNSRITPGIKGYQEMVVTLADTAITYGSGLVEVFATPAMVAFMELTALKSIDELLPENATSVGTEVNIKHLRASAVGHKLHCESQVLESAGRRIVFEVLVFDEELLVGHGTHTRFIVDKDKFMNQI